MEKGFKYGGQLITFLLMVLWVYTAVNKLSNFHLFEIQMNKQTLPRWLISVLIYTLPETELLTACLLFFPKTNRAGLFVSAMLMILFTGYVGLVLTHAFSRVPCSCGGVLRFMGWKLHFFFNIFFLLLSVSGLYITNRERSVIGTE